MIDQIYIPRLSSFSLSFPNPLYASKEGLVAWGGDLRPNRVINAYLNGIFPWFSKDDPPLWWSPDPRLILYPNEIKISKSLKKSFKKFTFRIDTNFKSVIENCAKIRQKEGTWITDEVIESYIELHKLGFAHSIESYYQNELVGGLYGIAIGSMFCGESMFSLKRDSSKAALVYLCKHLNHKGFDVIDCQIPTKHLKSLGAKEIKRVEFLKLLKSSLQKTPTFL